MKHDIKKPVIASNEVTFLQMRSVGSHNTSEKDKEGKKEKILNGITSHPQ